MVEINPGVMLHQWEVFTSFLEMRIPVVGRVGVTDRCSFPIIG
jgi:hypothetical protein